MTSMKKIRTQILSQRSVNVHSNMLHLRIKIRFYCSVSIKPLGEPPSPSPFAFTHAKNYSHFGRGWAAGHRTNRSLPAWGQCGLILKVSLHPGSQPPSGCHSHLSVVKENQEKAMRVSGNLLPSIRKMLCQFKFHSGRRKDLRLR